MSQGLARSSISQAISGMSILGRLSSFAAETVKKYGDNIRKAFSFDITKQVEKTIRRGTFTFQSGNLSKKIRVRPDEEGNLELYDMTLRRNIDKMFNKTADELIQSLADGQERFGANWRLTRGNVREETGEFPEIEKITPKDSFDVLKLFKEDITNGPLFKGLKSITNLANTPTELPKFSTSLKNFFTGTSLDKYYGASTKDALLHNLPDLNIGERLKNVVKKSIAHITEPKTELPSFKDISKNIFLEKIHGASTKDALLHNLPDLNLGERLGNLGKSAITAPFDFLKKTGDGVKSLGTKAWGGMGKVLGVPPARWNALGKGLAPIAGMGALGGALGIVFSILMSLLDAFNPFKPILEALTTIFGVYGEILSTAFMPLIEEMFEVMLSDTTISLLTTLASAIANVVSVFFPLGAALAPLGQLLLSVLLVPLQLFGPILVALSTPLNMVITVIGTLIGWVSDFVGFFLSNLQPVFNTISDFFNAIVHFDFSGATRALANIVVDFLNFIVRIVNKYFGWAGANWSEIPRYATGGLIYGPTLGILGEKGPELVVPYDELKKQGRVGGSGDINITIHGDITEDKLRDLRHEMLLKGVY